ncbi:TetR/AcrR family transcriptional regulator [Amycolatopsis sp. CA-126428]|uniref:TetR/AcrR family transcriptional regulator n=1 Tax=Amycolatopsis sp. CA-126428 TaxID=2073158 RepID=UPI000CD090E8|nr:TetR/AcrR family transcriptional regulator [Amycolatopsis sp. CA-126428]
MERADAARNRRAILRAAEELLASHDLAEVSMDRVAAAAGVGKGTVFHRFGNREGLMRALVESRVQALSDAVSSGPPPLGPGAPPASRLAAFFDAVVELATRNVKVMAAFEQASTDRLNSPIYVSWHAHVAGLIASATPSLDADLTAHLLLGSLHSDLMLQFLKTGETDRLASGLRSMIATLLR